MTRSTSSLIGACAVVLLACQAPQAAVAPTDTVAVRATVATPTVGRALAVAVAVGSPTPTAVLVGDYPTLVRQRVERIQQGLNKFEQQLGEAQKAPMRMADDDWRAQTGSLLDELAAASADLRALGARSGAQASLYADVQKLQDSLDFVVSEYRMAFDFDPDASHFLRAGRAEKTTADEVESLLSDLRRPSPGPAPTPSFAR
jgi:hypothetical protein